MTGNGHPEPNDEGPARGAEAPTASPEQPAGADSVVAALERKAAEHWEQYLRTAAELENLRRRAAREVENARKYGIERLADRLLPVRDSLEAGIGAATADASVLLEGTRATLRLLDQALEGAGIRAVDPHGEPFDPNQHEAIGMRAAPDVEPGTVVEVVQKGFQIQDRLLRPARVLVAQAPATERPS
jgi:molecular chaperone GrpE